MVVEEKTYRKERKQRHRVMTFKFYPEKVCIYEHMCVTHMHVF